MEKNKLFEAYAPRLQVSENVYKKAHEGKGIDSNIKLTTAICLNNTNKFLTEAFANSVGTQRSDMGLWKKFCLNLVTVALPQLIAHEIVITKALSSMSGFITYIEYTTGSTKGETKQGDVFNSPFRLGDIDVNYTSENVIESFTGDGSTTEFTVMWPNVVAVAKVTVDGVEVEGSTFTPEGVITLAEAPAEDAAVKIAYVYDNVKIPQNDLPLINAQVKSIPLIAKARRVAIYYSQIAAFQAKTDYGFDLGDELAKQAVARLNYEIDTEVIGLLDKTAGAADGDLEFNKTLPYGVNKRDHYSAFAEVVEIAKQKIFDKTKRFSPNYMLIASNVLPVLTFCEGFKAAASGAKNGPYFAGTLNSLKVFVSPAIAAGRFVLGVNGDDMMTSAAVYAPYMPVVPTQLLGYADGGNSQGWSTMYALEVLNPDLVIAGEIVAKPQIVTTQQA